MRRERVQRTILGLRLIADTGISGVQELGAVLARQLGLPDSSYAARRVFQDYLVESKLVHYAVLPYFRRGLAVVRLSLAGDLLCQEAGWQVVESEWERLLRLHNAENTPAHAAMILAFCREARRRNFTVQLVPVIDGLPLEAVPDVLVEQGGQRWYVEIERHRRFKPEKWRNQEAIQGFTAFCTRSPRRRERLAADINRLGIAGFGTDLESLLQRSQSAAPGPLWVQRW